MPSPHPECRPTKHNTAHSEHGRECPQPERRRQSSGDELRARRAELERQWQVRDAEGAATPSHGNIAQRAFDIYCSRGCEPGHELDDWLQAERELHRAPGLTAM